VPYKSSYYYYNYSWVLTTQCSTNCLFYLVHNWSQFTDKQLVKLVSYKVLVMGSTRWFG